MGSSMSTTDEALLREKGMTILPPYTRDHNTRAHRRARNLVLALVIVFCLFYGIAFALFAPSLIVGLIAPLAILGLLVVWSLPDLRRSPTEALWGLIFAFMVCLIMWPNYIALALPGMPWITMVRITGFPLASLLLIRVSTSPAFRSQIMDVLRAAPYLWKILIVFIIIQCVSVGFSNNPFFSLDRLLIDQLSWTAMFFASASVFLKPGRVEKMAALIWAMAIGVGCIAILEWRHQHIPWAGHIPSFLQIADPSVQRSLGAVARGDGVYRAKGTFDTPLGLGEYMALSTPFIIRFAVGPYNWLTRAAAVGSCAFVMFVAWCSGSRCGTIGVPIAALAYGAVWSLLKWRREPSNLLGPAVVLSYATLGLVMVAAVTFIGRLHQIVFGNGSQSASTRDRLEQIHLGIPKILSHPWGYGIGQGGHTLGFAPYGVLTIDNYYLDIALQYGIVGFIIFYGMLLIGIFYCLKATFTIESKSRDLGFFLSIAISLSVFFLIKSSYSGEGNHPLVFMMLGMVAAMLHRAIRTSPRAISAAGAVGRPQPTGRRLQPAAARPSVPRSPAGYLGASS